MDITRIFDVVASYDTRFVVGWALLWYGLGVLSAALAWARERRRAHAKLAESADRIRLELSGALGHVVWMCDHGDQVHMQCICGEVSLRYMKGDPTADKLMALWEEEHLSEMESANV